MSSLAQMKAEAASIVKTSPSDDTRRLAVLISQLCDLVEQAENKAVTAVQVAKSAKPNVMKDF